MRAEGRDEVPAGHSKSAPSGTRLAAGQSSPLLAASLAFCLGLATLPASADNAPKPAVIGPSFWRTSQLYELCTSRLQPDVAHCEGFITGVASVMQNDQLARMQVCIPKGTSSKDVVDNKVVGFLREKADSDDMKAASVTIIGPALAVLYNCTPGRPPQPRP